MYRNLLVHIPTERSGRPAVDGSVSLAMICGAHLDAIATGRGDVVRLCQAIEQLNDPTQAIEVEQMLCSHCGRNLRG